MTTNSHDFLSSLFGLQGKVTVVIGAGGHLCSALSRGLAQAGSKVAVVDIRWEKATRIASEISAAGCGDVKAFQADAVSKESLTNLRDVVLDTYGHIDVVINGAGINDPTPFLDVSLEAWNSVMDSQITATMLGSQVFGEIMLAQRGGSIINISSASAGPPLSRAFAYSVAKAGIVNLTQNLAREWALSGVRVNSIRPGFFPTEWNRNNFITSERETSILDHTPMRRFGEPQELVSAAIWLASDSASFVTGAEITVDGGFSCMTI